MISLVKFECEQPGEPQEYPHLTVMSDNDAEQKTTLLEQLTNGKFYCGQDDGMWFFGVPTAQLNVLKALFPNEVIRVESEDDYPWDHQP